MAVERVLATRVEDANLSRLVFSDILRDLHGLAEANLAADSGEIVRRLTSLDPRDGRHGPAVGPVPSHARRHHQVDSELAKLGSDG